MNYFAHGFRYLDRPWFLAGTAAPDWLSVADRKVRIQARTVERLAGDETPEREIAAGVLRHLEDDRWFHANPAFLEISAAMTMDLREVVGRGNGHRPSFFAHIATEVLLDAVLIEDEPGLLDAYYAELERIDSELVQQAVNKMSRGSTDRLATWVHRFRQAEFLRDYADDRTLLRRLNQVLHRARLDEFPEDVEPVLQHARAKVRERAGELLPPE